MLCFYVLVYARNLILDFYAPQEYLISSYIRDKLAPIKLGRYGEDLLFYLYYTNCGDILQLAAAAEL